MREPAADRSRLIADSVDQAPVEHNRRLLKGKRLTGISIAAALYAAFHMLALNGVSLSALTGGVVAHPFFA